MPFVQQKIVPVLPTAAAAGSVGQGGERGGSDSGGGSCTSSGGGDRGGSGSEAAYGGVRGGSDGGGDREEGDRESCGSGGSSSSTGGDSSGSAVDVGGGAGNGSSGRGVGWGSFKNGDSGMRGDSGGVVPVAGGKGGSGGAVGIRAEEEQPQLGLLLTLSKRATMLTRALEELPRAAGSGTTDQGAGQAREHVVKEAEVLLLALGVAARHLADRLLDAGPWPEVASCGEAPLQSTARGLSAGYDGQIRETLALTARAMCHLATAVAWEAAVSAAAAVGAELPKSHVNVPWFVHAVVEYMVLLAQPALLPPAQLLACQPHRLLAAACTLAAALPANTEDALCCHVAALTVTLASHDALSSRVQRWLAPHPPLPPLEAAGSCFGGGGGGGGRGGGGTGGGRSAVQDACDGCLAEPMGLAMRKAMGVDPPLAAAVCALLRVAGRELRPSREALCCVGGGGGCAAEVAEASAPTGGGSGGRGTAYGEEAEAHCSGRGGGGATAEGGGRSWSTTLEARASCSRGGGGGAAEAAQAGAHGCGGGGRGSYLEADAPCCGGGGGNTTLEADELGFRHSAAGTRDFVLERLGYYSPLSTKGSVSPDGPTPAGKQCKALGATGPPPPPPPSPSPPLRPLPPPLALPPGRAGALPRLRMCGNPRCDNFAGECEGALPLKQCGGCRAVRYCGADCQRVHWREGHRAECKALAE